MRAGHYDYDIGKLSEAHAWTAKKGRLYSILIRIASIILKKPISMHNIFSYYSKFHQQFRNIIYNHI